MTEPTHPAPSDEQLAAVAGNVGIVRKMLIEVFGVDHPPGRDGVVLLDGFMTRQHEHGDPSSRDGLANVVACYIGEALIAEAGGRWIQHPDYGLGVDLGADIIAFPLAKAAKHLANGPGDSVGSFFDIVIMARSERRSGSANRNPKPGA